MASDHTSDEQLPADPLLKSGAFIDVNRSTDDTGTPIKPKEDATSSSPVSEGVHTPVASSVPTYVTPVSQWRPDAPPQPESSSERPNWLPEDWNLERKVRVSGATAGTVDRYYISPAGKKFRSKTEVLNFIETGDKRKRKPDSKPESGSGADPAAAAAAAASASGAGSSQKKEKKAKSGGQRKKQEQNGKDFSNLAFDFKNPPQATTWVPKDESNNEWTPLVGNVVVPEAEQAQWSNAKERVTEVEKGDGAAAV